MPEELAPDFLNQEVPRFRFIIRCRKCRRKFNTNIFEAECPFCYVESIGAAIIWPENHEYADSPAAPSQDDDLTKDWLALGAPPGS